MFVKGHGNLQQICTHETGVGLFKSRTEYNIMWKHFHYGYFPSVTGNKASFAIYIWSVSSYVLCCQKYCFLRKDLIHNNITGFINYTKKWTFQQLNCWAYTVHWFQCMKRQLYCDGVSPLLFFVSLFCGFCLPNMLMCDYCICVWSLNE